MKLSKIFPFQKESKENERNRVPSPSNPSPSSPAPLPRPMPSKPSISSSVSISSLISTLSSLPIAPVPSLLATEVDRISNESSPKKACGLVSYFKYIRSKRRMKEYEKLKAMYTPLIMKLKTNYLHNCTLEWKSDEMSVDDFEGLKTIGRGGFATVKFGKCIKTGEVLAIKILNKREIVGGNLVENIVAEKQFLRSIDFPFIVKVKYHFSDNSNLYMVMDYCAGGDLYRLLHGESAFAEPVIRFYGAQIVLALEFLHSIDIIYRDLKSENVLIDSTGYCKLTDFGFSKRTSHLTHSFCGTPVYIAPEVIKRKGYTSTIDWWAFGVLLFEMGTGMVPFLGGSTEIVLNKIMYSEVILPTHFSKKFGHLIRNLLTKDPSSRIGCTGDGADDIKRHAWFANVNWLKLFEKKIKPFHIPSLNTMDTSIVSTREEIEVEQASRCLYVREFERF